MSKSVRGSMFPVRTTPLKVFRFALGTIDRPASGLWRLWIQEDDVRLRVQAARETVELTAYRTGRWRIEAGGAVGRWTRPKEFRPGWIRGPDLVIPASGIVLPLPAPDPFAAEPITWLAPPAIGRRARFSLLFAGPRAAENPWQPTDAPETTAVVVLTLRTAGTLHVCRTDEPDEDAAPPGPERPGQLAIVVSADRAGLPSLIESHES